MAPGCAAILALALPLLHAAAAAAAEQPGSYALVADAGSTGTRVYLFHYTAGDGKVEVTDVGKGPALSSFQSSPEKAAEAVAPQLEKAKGLIPAGSHKSVPVSVFATAGMRLVAPAAQEAIYRGLRAGLLAAGSAAGAFAFDGAALEARTISGREEGVFALIAANYLAKRLHTSLKATTGSLMGVLDLGGSSTQVAAPPSLSSGEHLVAKLGSEHTFVRSFLNLGMERMRQRTYQRFTELASATSRTRGAVANPCAFYGYTEGGEVWRGTGEASPCEAAVKAVLEHERTSCAVSAEEPATECLSAGVPIPPGPEASAKFFLISGYMYVTDFAGWWLKQPGVRPDGFTVPEADRALATPTIRELRAAADVLCSESWSSLSAIALDPARKHSFTPPKKVPHRCFEINYIVALLSSGYGFREEARLFDIVEDIDGLEIEWTLGAFLHGMASAGSAPAQEL